MRHWRGKKRLLHASASLRTEGTPAISPGPPVVDLYRDRFALTASESITIVNDAGRSLATAIWLPQVGITRFPSRAERWQR